MSSTHPDNDVNASARRERLAAEAADWVLRTENGLADPRLRQEFSEWLVRSPLHVEEYLAAASTWEALRLVRFDKTSIEALVSAATSAPDDFGKVVSLGLTHTRFQNRSDESSEPGDQPNETGDNRGSLTLQQRAADISDPARRHWIAAAASLAAVALGVGAISLVSQRRRRESVAALMFQTVVGQQRRVLLADQSVMLLDTNSAVRVRWMRSERHVDLLRGQVHLEVTPDTARPFAVTTRQASVRVLGTTFDVRTDATVTRVAVVKGLVEVTQTTPPGKNTRRPGNNQSPERVELRAGDRVAVSSDQVKLNSGPPVSVLTAWTKQRLIFRDQSLADVVSEFNRYQLAPMVITDARLANVRISGVFDTKDPSSLLEYLQIFEKAIIRHSTDGAVYISASAQSSE